MTEAAAIMIFACSKAEQDDLTPEQGKAAVALIKELNDGQDD